MVRSITHKARGILNPKLGEQKFHLARYEPSTELSFFVEHYWAVQWDLRGQAPYHSETLPHPSIHLTVEPDSSSIVGVVTRKFSRLLESEGWVFGIKFRPGAFRAFVPSALSAYSDKNIPIFQLFGERGRGYADALRGVYDQANGDATRVAIAEEFLCGCAPARDENIALVNEIVEATIADRTITKVDHLVDRFKLNKRSLQRLFNEYVGVSPKWVIQRYRLHEATEQMAAGATVDWAKLAVDLGYFDQAHFIKDFKALVGLTPAQYAKRME